MRGHSSGSIGSLMDKRTIFYIVLVSLTFFGLNFYFSKQRAAQTEAHRVAQASKNISEQERLSQELEARTASISSLPLVVIDTNHHGLLLGDAVFTLAWSLPPPASIQVENNRYVLETEGASLNTPIVYAAPKFAHLDIPVLSDFQDVQLVSFNPTPQVSLAQYQQGRLKVLGTTPKSNALALVKHDNQWFAVGFYESAGRLFVPLQNLPLISPMVRLVRENPNASESQDYYVLENETIQLVFSNVGGALSEINLPLHNKEDTQSVVNEIELDRDIAETSPLNARFPLFPYHLPSTSEVMQPKKVGHYYPLIRRTLETNRGLTSLQPQYYALNIVSDYPEVAELVYAVESFTADSIVFSNTQSHRKIIKTYRLLPDVPYCFEVSVKVEGDTRGLWITSGVPEVEIMSNTSSPGVQYRVARKGKSEMEKLSLPKPNGTLSSASVSPEWIVNSNGYLGVILNPLSQIGNGYRVVSIPGDLVPTRLSLLDPKHAPYPANKYPGYQVFLPLPQKAGTHTFRVYTGPFEEKTLKIVDKKLKEIQGENPHFTAARNFYGWFSFISKPFARLLFIVMQFFHFLTHSWGISIILLTVFLRLILYPLNAWSIKSMRRMQQLAPQVQAFQKQYAKDPKRAQIEIMNLYREKKVNPFMGCIPILIQLPFLIAMFDLLKSSFQLRGASFIPGWIDNLTTPDVLFCWGTPVFFFGTCFHLLPFLLGGIMFLQQRMSSGQNIDINQMTDQQRQQKAMGTIMTVVFTVMFYNFPSGLNIYWLSSMGLGIIQQWITNKMLDKQGQKPEVIVPKKGPTVKK